MSCKSWWDSLFHGERRLEVTTRAVVTSILPLALAYGGFWDSGLRTLAPIYFIVFATNMPPAMWSFTMMFTLLLGGVIPGLLALTSVFAVGLASNTPGLAYLMAAFWTILVSPWLAPQLGAGVKLQMLMFVSMVNFLFVVFFDFIFEGLVYGAEASTVQETACKISADQPFSPIGHELAKQICAGTINVTEACIDWPRDIIAQTDEAYLNDYLDGEQICVVFQSPYIFITLTHNTLWFCRLMWSINGIAVQAIFATFVGFCGFGVAVLLPPQRFVGNTVRSGVVGISKMCQVRIQRLLEMRREGAPELDFNSFITFKDTSDVAGLRKANALTAMELHVEEPGPGISFYGQMHQVIVDIQKVFLGIYFYASTCDPATEMTTTEEALLETSKDVMHLCAFALALEPTQTAGGRIVFQETSSHLQELKEKLESLIPKLKQGESDDSEEKNATENLVRYTSSIFVLGEASHKLLAEIMTLLKLESNSSCHGFGKTLLGLSYGAVAPWARLVDVALKIPLTKKICSQDRKRILRQITFETQMLVSLLVTLAIPVFSTSIREWLLVPVGTLPTGKFGLWICVPVFAVMQPTLEGTMKRAFMRISGTLLGGLMGYFAALAFQAESNPAAGCSVLVFSVFLVFFFGVEEDPKNGLFPLSYGYILQTLALTSFIVSIDFIGSCSIALNGEQVCQYTPGTMTALRICGQLLGTGVSLFVAHFILPRNGGRLCRNILSEVVDFTWDKFKETYDQAEKQFQQQGELSQIDLNLSKAEMMIEECKMLFANTILLTQVPIYEADLDIPALGLMTEELLLCMTLLLKGATCSLQDRALAKHFIENDRLILKSMSGCLRYGATNLQSGAQSFTKHYFCSFNADKEFQQATDSYLQAVTVNADLTTSLNIANSNIAQRQLRKHLHKVLTNSEYQTALLKKVQSSNEEEQEQQEQQKIEII